MNHPSYPNASVHPEAIIGQGVHIGPYSFIDKNVVVGDGTWIGPSVTVFEGARIGAHCQIFPNAVISGVPQDLKFKGEPTTAELGDHSIVREYVTINRGTAAAGRTVVGAHCLLMAYAHVAHDCIIGDRVILANGVNLAGHVEIEDWAILEGLVAVQQFTRIGTHAFVAGGSLVRKNIPPFVRAAREPITYIGVNSVGLQRRGFSAEMIAHIQDIYRIIFVKPNNLTRALATVREDLPDTPEKHQILHFIEHYRTKGLMRGYRQKAQGHGD